MPKKLNPALDLLMSSPYANTEDLHIGRSTVDAKIKEIFREINDYKLLILEERMEKMGITGEISPDLIVCEIRDGEETYRYKDGSSEGLRIVTFVAKEPSLYDQNFSCSIQYY